ncbi:hypothetical protein, partial [Streptomyces scabiei]
DRGATAPATATAPPEPSKSTEPPARKEADEPSPTPSKPPGSARPSPGPGTGAPTGSGRVKAYDTEGGRVVLSLAEDYATLVSATPGSGWSMQVWKTETWIRVDFAAGADRVSVFCTWHDSAPRVDVQNF